MILPTRLATWTFLALGPIALVPAWLGASYWPVWAAAVAAWLALLAIDAVALGPSRRPHVSFDLPGIGAVGTEVELGVRIDSPPGARARRIAILPEVDPERIASPEPLVRPIDPGATDDAHLNLSLVRRGEGRLRAVWCRIVGPLGLAAHSTRHDTDESIAIVPDTASVRSTALRLAGTLTTRRSLRIERYTGDGSEFDSLREFVPGIDPRSIDWKASARHRELLYRETRAERDHTVILAIDTGHLMAETVAGLARLDHAIHGALALAWAALRTGDRVGLFAFDSRPRLSLAPTGRMSSFERIRAATAGLVETPDETNYTLGITELSSRLSRRALLVVFTDFVDSTSAELMVENLDRLAKRHLVLFVSLRDPDVVERAKAAPRDSAAVHEAVVARGLLRERDAVLRRLRSAGVRCIDTDPRTFSPRIVERYLDIKRRELV